MSNACTHLHNCVECHKEYPCDFPECISLAGFQRLCQLCSYLYGWRQKQDRESNDWSAL